MNSWMPDKTDVREVFDSIADSFSKTRQGGWSEVDGYIGELEGGELALDVGCGNGRYMEYLDERFSRVVGVDFSFNLLRYVSTGYAVLGDAEYLPVRDEIVDFCLYIATLHHIPGRESRNNTLSEIYRVLEPGGYVFLSVWAIEHKRFDGMRDEIRANDGDIYVPWRSGDLEETYQRYYHIFTEDELRDELGDSSLEIVDITNSSGNYFAELRKSRENI